MVVLNGHKAVRMQSAYNYNTSHYSIQASPFCTWHVCGSGILVEGHIRLNCWVEILWGRKDGSGVGLSCCWRVVDTDCWTWNFTWTCDTERRSIREACWTFFTDVTRETGTQHCSTYGSYVSLSYVARASLRSTEYVECTKFWQGQNVLIVACVHNKMHVFISNTATIATP